MVTMVWVVTRFRLKALPGISSSCKMENACKGKPMVSGADGSDLGELPSPADNPRVEQSLLHAASRLGTDTALI